jgi:hypothetical protein
MIGWGVRSKQEMRGNEMKERDNLQTYMYKQTYITQPQRNKKKKAKP